MFGGCRSVFPHLLTIEVRESRPWIHNCVCGKLQVCATASKIAILGNVSFLAGRLLESGKKAPTIATFIKRQNNKAYGRLFVQLLVLAEVRRRKQSLRNKVRRPKSLTHIPSPTSVQVCSRLILLKASKIRAVLAGTISADGVANESIGGQQN